MADKYIKLETDGSLSELEATVSSTGVAEAGDIVALDASGKIDQSMLPTGIGADLAVIPTEETLLPGDFVTVVIDASGNPGVYKADASNPARRADGFVLTGYTHPDNADVYFEGLNNQVSGLTIGADVFLSNATAGEPTITAPTTAGHIVQRIGRALSATTISFEPAQAIKLA